MGENKLANLPEMEKMSIWNDWKYSEEEIKLIRDAYNKAAGAKPLVITEKKPFIGQTVHYYDHYHHQRAAIVTAIHRDNEEVDLCVLYPTRQEFIQHVKHDADHEKETWDFIR